METFSVNDLHNLPIYDVNCSSNSFIDKSKNIAIRMRDNIIEEREREIQMLRRQIKEQSLSKLPDRYYISDEATVLIWKDGTKTIVRRTDDDVHDKRLAFLTAFFQKNCGMTKNKANKYLASLEDKKEKEKKETVEFGKLISEAVHKYANEFRKGETKDGDKV